MHGQFVWYELMTSDSSGAKKFYPAVTGWGTEDWDKQQYTMWTVGGVPLGGIVQLRPDQMQQGMPSNWMPYIEAGDVDATARQAVAQGGKVLFGPQDIPGTGRFAVVADPQGAVFAIYKSLSPSEGYDGTPDVGRFAWHELSTTDPVAAYDFYQKLFGWEKTNAFDMGPDLGGMYQMYGRKGKQYGGIYKDVRGTPPFWLCYIHVADLKSAVSAATKNGAKVMQPPMEVPGGDWVAVLTDPQGAHFALHQAPAKASAKSGGAKASKPKKSAAKARKKTTARPAKKKKGVARKKAKATKSKARGKAVRAKPKSKGKARPKKRAMKRRAPAKRRAKAKKRRR
jgi:predicted enzyme related to lactoylglutathione lyase